MKDYVQKLQKFFKKLWKRFTNYNNSKKWFVLYLIILTFFLLFPSLVRIDGMRGIEGSSYSLLFSTGYFRSLVVVLISLVFLLGWNLSVKFKGFVINLFSLREDEPLVDFAFLWVIASVFMGIVDTVGVASVVSNRISLTNWAVFSQILLLIGLVWSFVSLWQSAKKTSKKTKILNIVEEQSSRTSVDVAARPKRPLNHLFDDLEE
jgi:hypothetical protein